jgi:hypothetical protein
MREGLRRLDLDQRLSRTSSASAHEAGALDKQPQEEPACEIHPLL